MFYEDDYVATYTSMDAPAASPFGSAAANSTPVSPSLNGSISGSSAAGSQNETSTSAKNRKIKCFGGTLFSNICRSMVRRFDLYGKKGHITAHKNYYDAIQGVVDNYNRFSPNSRHFVADSKEIGFNLGRIVAERNRYLSKRAKAIETQPNPTLQDDADEVMWHSGDIVCVMAENLAIFVGRVTTNAPLDMTTGNIMPNMTAVRKIFDFCVEGKNYMLGRDHIFKSTSLKMIGLPLNCIQIQLKAYVDVENSHNLISDNGDMLLENQRCDMQHRTGDLVLLDLGDQWQSFWPLVAEVKTVYEKRGKMRIKWIDGIIDGKYTPWMINGKRKEETVVIAAHYLCGFDLEYGYLPECVRATALKQLEKNKEMGAQNDESDDDMDENFNSDEEL